MAKIKICQKYSFFLRTFDGKKNWFLHTWDHEYRTWTCLFADVVVLMCRCYQLPFGGYLFSIQIVLNILLFWICAVLKVLPHFNCWFLTIFFCSLKMRQHFILKCTQWIITPQIWQFLILKWTLTVKASHDHIGRHRDAAMH